jgi:hypothetical protein
MTIDKALLNTKGRFATVETTHKGTFSAKVNNITNSYVTLGVPAQNKTLKISKDKIASIRCGRKLYNRK